MHPPTSTVTPPVATTRKHFQRKLLSLSDENQELHQRLESTEHECIELRERTQLQQLQIEELENAIRSLSDGKGDAHVSRNEDVIVKSKKIAELTLELNKTSLSSKDHQAGPNGSLSTTQCVALTESAESTSRNSCTETMALFAELQKFKQKCESLERSMVTLKQKNGEREIKSAKNLRLMRQQLDVMERERTRSLDLQASMEHQIRQLLEENEEKAEHIALIEGLLEVERVSKSRIFRNDQDCQAETNAPQFSKTPSWETNGSSFPPILVAASLDDDTASETESQADP